MKENNTHPNSRKESAAKHLTLFLLFVFMLFTLASCGNQKSVPDDLAITLVGECEYDDYEDYPISGSVIHNRYDSESHLEYVTVVSKSEGTFGYILSTCEVIFQYDRSSDLWSLLSAGEWTEPEYVYNDELVDDWHITNDYGDYEIEIVRVEEDTIQLNYYVTKEFTAYPENVVLEFSGSATISDYSKRLVIKVELPTGFINADGSQYVTLYIRPDIEEGVSHAIILDRINCMH